MSTIVVGREREISAACSALDGAEQQPAGVLLVGEPGIGKTTVWSAVVEHAAGHGFDVLLARPAEAEAELPYGLLIDLFAHVDDHVLSGLDGARRAALEGALRRGERGSTVDPSAVALAVRGVLRSLAERRPVLVAIDDVQWADTSSMRALTFALRRLDDVPIGLVATMRSGSAVELAALPGNARHRFEQLELSGLGERHLAELVFARAGRTLTPSQLTRIAELSNGNPYYALELAATGDPALPLPESLAAALRARLATLSPSARAVGLTAATLGRFDESMHTAIHRRALDELRTESIVVVRSGVPTFAHPLLGSTLLDMHTSAEQRAVHLSLARSLTNPDERALHLGRGSTEPSEDVAAELEAAADRLDRRGAPGAAAALVERAARLTPATDDAAILRRTLKASDLYQAAGEADDHVRPLLEGLAGSLPAGVDRARVLVRLGWLGAQQGTMPLSESIACQERALAEAEGGGDVTTAAHAVLARLLGNTGDYRAALTHAERAAGGGEPVVSNLMFPSPGGELATARFFAGEGLDEAMLMAGIALEKAVGRIGEPYQSPRLQLALGLLFTGQLDRARALLLELLEQSTELGRIRSLAGCVLHLTELELRSGDVVRAEGYAREFVHLDGQLRGDLGAEWYPSGTVALHLGRVDDARRILQTGADGARQAESTIWLAHHLEALGHLELVVGNLAAAREALCDLPTLLRGTGLGEWAVHPFHPDAIEVLVGLGELDEADALQRELEEYGRRLDRPWGLATAARSEALLASARGDVGRALEAAERALAEHERLQWPLEHGRTLLVTGEILRRLGRRRDATARLDEASAIFGSLDNPLWLARTEEERRRLGGRSRSRDGLTPTEARVAALASEGLRNGEIAARLFVTPKTVEATLTRVYRKLGVRSRTELARTLQG